MSAHKKWGISYGLKQVIPWEIFFGFSLFLLVLYIPVYEKNQHVQGWNPTTTTSFPIFGFSLLLLLLLLLLLCLPNIPNKFYHGTVSYQLSAQHKGGLVSVVWEKVVSAHGYFLKRGVPWKLFFGFLLFYQYYVFLMFKRNYHGTGSK